MPSSVNPALALKVPLLLSGRMEGRKKGRAGERKERGKKERRKERRKGEWERRGPYGKQLWESSERPPAEKA